jgi:large subunit ribosomal protein L4
MVKVSLYSASNKKTGNIDLPADFGGEINKVLLAQAIRVYEDRLHTGLSKVKTRGEITASTRKIYRQKGTGNARHGALSAPIFVGGGKAHGPKGVKRVLTLPKKMKKKAFLSALSLKQKQGKVLVVDSIDKLTKTKQAADLINKIIKSEKDLHKNQKFTLVLSDTNNKATLALRNLAKIEIIPLANLNTYSVYKAGVLLIDKEALAGLDSKLTKKSVTEKPEKKADKTKKISKPKSEKKPKTL